jgi:hypothetical protein
MLGRKKYSPPAIWIKVSTSTMRRNGCCGMVKFPLGPTSGSVSSKRVAKFWLRIQVF